MTDRRFDIHDACGRGSKALMLTACVLMGACISPSRLEPRPVRIAACQILVDGDREATLVRIEEALERAAEDGAQIACFPEACLFGWVNPNAHQDADPIPGATTERLATLARRYDMLLAVGMAERDGDKLYNAVVLIDRDGSLLAHHRKVNVLAELMDPPYTQGQSSDVAFADTSLGRIGLLICADTFEDELVDRLAAVQPDLVLVPYGWAAPEESWPEHGASLHAWIANTARRTGAAVLGVDATGTLSHGPWAGFVLGGQSAFSDAGGNISPPLADRASEVRVFEVPETQED